MFELIPWRNYRASLVRPRKDLFDWVFNEVEVPRIWETEREWVPAFDVSETESEIIVRAELPGMDVADIDITLTDGLLTLKGEKKQEKEDERENYHRLERRYGSFSRTLALPKVVKAEAIDASYKDGVLTVTLPKGDEHKPKKIEVKS
ncbi:MAG: Hsp20/alpha crystallin family protein [Deltaproteobacteria bacterium]|nr:MAG: Hsp20/alpha crystallin family protein [Deltaproteobacteria bacterium]